MNQPEFLVRILLESPEDEPMEDPKDFLNNYEIDEGFEQIGGDFGDPWVHGGSWHNKYTGDIVHIDGLEGNGIKEIDYWNIELTAAEKAEILAQFPVAIDPEYPEDGDGNDLARERAEDELKSRKSDEATSAQTQQAYRFCDEEIGPDDWPDQAEIAAQFDDPGIWDDMPTAQKWIEIGNYHGFQELDHYPDDYTKAELSKYLGLEL